MSITLSRIEWFLRQNYFLPHIFLADLLFSWSSKFAQCTPLYVVFSHHLRLVPPPLNLACDTSVILSTKEDSLQRSVTTRFIAPLSSIGQHDKHVVLLVWHPNVGFNGTASNARRVSTCSSIITLCYCSTTNDFWYCFWAGCLYFFWNFALVHYKYNLISQDIWQSIKTQIYPSTLAFKNVFNIFVSLGFYKHTALTDVLEVK